MAAESRTPFSELDPSVRAYNWCVLHGVHYVDQVQPIIDKFPPTWRIIEELRELLDAWQGSHPGMSHRDDALRALTDWEPESEHERGADDRLDRSSVAVLNTPVGWFGVVVSESGRWEWECLHADWELETDTWTGRHLTPGQARECALTELARRRALAARVGTPWRARPPRTPGEP
jgi:hypothetical protein